MQETEVNIHPPKHSSSRNGLGLPNCTKSFEQISPTVIVTTEIWNEMAKPWTQGEIIVAKQGYTWVTKWEEGKNYVIEKIFDDQGNFVAIYCDICSLVRKVNDGYEFEDWYLDVWQPANQHPQLLDEDEFEAAIKSGYLTEEQANIARKATSQLMEELERNIPDF